MSSLQVVGFRHYAMATKNINHLHKKVGLPNKTKIFFPFTKQLKQITNVRSIYDKILHPNSQNKNKITIKYLEIISERN